MKTEKPYLLIAGAGSGKTTNMVKEILKCLPALEPHRFLVAITYTNAATNSIKERLSQHTKIPPNVFIGTTYAFFNKFLVLPYGSLFPRVTVDKLQVKKEHTIALDKIFFELDDKRLRDILKAKYPDWSKKDFQQKMVCENAFLNQLVKKGQIPFDKIASISSYLIKDNTIVREKISFRVQFLFIDEYQDSNNQQFIVFDEIRKSKKTKLYKVGDAEQFISNFSAGLKDFSKIPIIQHKSKYEIIENRMNNRCSSQITSFINNFNTQLQQEARFSTIEKNGVLFINKTDLLQIANTFKERTEIWDSEPNFKRFYLGYENKTYDTVSNKLGLVKISNDSKKTHNLLSEVLHIIAKITGQNSKQICEKHNINLVQLRILAVKLWKQNFDTLDEFKSYIEKILKLTIEPDLCDIKKIFDELKNLKEAPNKYLQTDFTTSIHKSKGLEATCVLVVASTNAELEKWLEDDHAVRVAVQYGKNSKVKSFEDHYRLGFVAFSRAKVALYIACLEKLNQKNIAQLQKLGVEILN